MLVMVAKDNFYSSKIIVQRKMVTCYTIILWYKRSGLAP